MRVKCRLHYDLLYEGGDNTRDLYVVFCFRWVARIPDVTDEIKYLIVFHLMVLYYNLLTEEFISPISH